MDAGNAADSGAADAAVRLLSARERSAAEIRMRLRQKGFDAETVESTIEWLRTTGLQDDRRFADTFAASAVRSRGLAARVVQTELRKRGLDPEVAARAAARSSEDEEETARAFARRRLAQLDAYPPKVRARRLHAYLARRGYSSELCRTIVEELTETVPEER